MTAKIANDGRDEDLTDLAKSGVSVDDAGIDEAEMVAEPIAVVIPGTVGEA